MTSNAEPRMYYALDAIGGYDGMFNRENVLASAGVAYRNPSSEMFGIHIPKNPAHLMIDSGGFQAATRWNGALAGERGLPGRFPYSPRELHDWAEKIRADVVAGMDVACELATNLFDMEKGYIWPESYRKRILESRDNQMRQRRVYESQGYSHDFMPVIQGREKGEYEEFIQWMAAEGFDQYDRIAVGTVCKRSDLDEILNIVLLVREYFPKKWIHLFGATLEIYKDRRFDGLYSSSDTAAWNWGGESKAHKKELFAEYQQKVEGYRGDVIPQNRLKQSKSRERTPGTSVQSGPAKKS